MIKTIKQTISNIYYWTKKKLIQFKKWIILIIFGAAVVAAPLISPSVPDIALQNIQADYEVSDIKNNYRLEKTAFILDAVDENAIQSEVGNKNSDEFTPELTLRKWDDECNFVVKYKHNEKKKDQKVDIENKKIKWKGKKVEVHYYDIKKGELLHDKILEADSFEVEVILLEKPDTNIVSFDIETKGLAFYYQPELTQEEKDDGAFRPENVIGSYAVYHESKQGDYSKMGLKNYRAGKAFHIYRPKIIDSAGTEVWGELNITDNLLTVEISQEFLDNAVYPVRHAAGLEFGYTGNAASAASVENRIFGIYSTPTENWNADSISAYLNSTVTNTINFTCALYGNHTNRNYIQTTDENAVSFTANVKKWETFDFSTKPALTASTEYGLMGFCALESGIISMYYDSTGGYIEWDGARIYADGWPATLSGSVFSGYRFSIYCTYTAAAAEERRMFLTQ